MAINRAEKDVLRGFLRQDAADVWQGGRSEYSAARAGFKAILWLEALWDVNNVMS